MASEGSDEDLWVYDLEREVMTRLTFSSADDFAPVWSPDGGRIAFASARDGGTPNLYWKRADGAGEAERLTTSDNWQIPASWSADGKWLIFQEEDSKTGWDIFKLSLEGEKKPEVFLRTPFPVGYPEISPDGRWLVYGSDESGQGEIYVRPFPGPGGKWQVSQKGAKGEAHWSSDGREIFYRRGNQMMVVSASAEGQSFRPGKPQVLFEVQDLVKLFPQPDFGVAPDGQRFVMFQSVEKGHETDPSQIVFIFHWFQEVRRLASAGSQ